MAYNYRDDPVLGCALAHWRDKRGGRVMPRHRDIDPTEIPPRVLPNLQIIDVVDGGARFRYRLVGTATVDAYGKDFTGQYPDEMLPHDLRDFVQGIFRRVCRSKAPLFLHSGYVTAKNLRLSSARVYMPLSDNGTDVSHIFAVLRFERGSSPNTRAWMEGATFDPATAYVEAIEVAPPVIQAAN